MSWSMRLVPILFLSACGGTFVTEEPSGKGGTDVGGSAGDRGNGGDESGGTSSGGASSGGKVGTGGKVASGGSTGTGGKVASGGSTGTGGKVGGTGGAGGSTTREPAKHRPSAVSCGTPPASLIPPGTGGASGAPLPPPDMCMTNTDCQSGPNGRCIFGRIGQYCTYDACFTDENCEAGAVCMCGSQSGPGNHCSQKGCRVDADCPGSWCSPTFSSCGTYSGVVGYACHTSTDECVDDADCTSSGAGIYCMYSPMVAHWVCSSSQCAG
jgi:hypothetical protein